MEKKDCLLAKLESAGGYISGSELAERLGVSRAAVWKLIQLLRKDGHEIEAVTNRGYRLSDTNDAVTTAGVIKHLGILADRISLEVLPCCQSTNLVLKERAAELPEWRTVIAGQQTGGRGRLGRSFYSPEGTGLYMSILLRPKLKAEDAVLITTSAAIAVCRAVEKLGSEHAQIKWVNDVFIRGRKVCGILTEAGFDLESSSMKYVILGVGINVTEPAGGFPPDLEHIAGAVFPQRQRDLRCRLAAAFLRQFYPIYMSLPQRDFVKEYRQRCYIVGQEVDVLLGGAVQHALALSVDDRCRLVVRYADGTEEALFSGEVSIRPRESQS